MIVTLKDANVQVLTNVSERAIVLQVRRPDGWLSAEYTLDADGALRLAEWLQTAANQIDDPEERTLRNA